MTTQISGRPTRSNCRYSGSLPRSLGSHLCGCLNTPRNSPCRWGHFWWSGIYPDLGRYPVWPNRRRDRGHGRRTFGQLHRACNRLFRIRHLLSPYHRSVGSGTAHAEYAQCSHCYACNLCDSPAGLAAVTDVLRDRRLCIRESRLLAYVPYRAGRPLVFHLGLSPRFASWNPCQPPSEWP